MSEHEWIVDIHGSKDIEAHHPVHGVLSAVEIERRLDVCDDLLAALKANMQWIGPPPTDPRSYDSQREDAWKLGRAAIVAAE